MPTILNYSLLATRNKGAKKQHIFLTSERRKGVLGTSNLYKVEQKKTSEYVDKHRRVSAPKKIYEYTISCAHFVHCESRLTTGAISFKLLLVFCCVGFGKAVANEKLLAFFCSSIFKEI